MSAGTDTRVGYVKCLNGACDHVGELTQVPIVIDVVDLMGEGVFAAVAITSNHYPRVTDDADLLCPHCGTHGALLDGPERVIPRVVG